MIQKIGLEQQQNDCLNTEKRNNWLQQKRKKMEMLPSCKSSVLKTHWIMCDSKRGETFSYNWSIDHTGRISGFQVGNNADTTDFPSHGQIVVTAPAGTRQALEDDNKLGAAPPKMHERTTSPIQWICHSGPVGSPFHHITVTCKGTLVKSLDGKLRISGGTYYDDQTNNKVGDFTGVCVSSEEE